MLEGLPATAAGGDVRVYVVWQQITFSDWTPPTDANLARIPDPRARQYYDAGNVVASAWKPVLARDSVVVQGEASYVKSAPAWDCALYFAPGTRWDAEPPQPTSTIAPIVEAPAALRLALAAPRP